MSVHVELPLPVRLDGTHVVVTPAGAEAVVKSTVPLNPPVEARETTDVAELPALNVTLVGFAEREKSGPPGRKNSTGELELTSFWPRSPPPQTSSRSFARE